MESPRVYAPAADASVPPVIDSSARKDEALGTTAARSVGWVVVDKWGSRIVTLVTIAVLGRMLAPEDFGVVALASMFMTFAGIFVDQGFGKALIQRQDLRPEHIDTAFGAAVGVAIVLTASTMLAAPWIAAGVSEPTLAPVLQWLAIGLVIDALAGAHYALLERAFKFKSLAIRRLTSSLAGAVVGIGCAIAGYGVWSLVAQTLVSSVVGLIALWLASDWRPRGLPKIKALRELWPVGFGVLGIELLGFFGAHTDRMVVAAFLGAQALGWYFMAMRIVGIMVEIFASIFSAVSLPMFSRLQDDHARLREWLYRLTGASSAAALPCFALAAALAPVLLPFVLGEQWTASVPIFQILALLGTINAVAYFDRNVLLATGRAKDALLLTLGQSILGVVLILIAAPYGVLAVAAAVVARQYLYWPIRLALLRRAVGIVPRQYLAQWARPLLASLLMAISVYCIAWYWPEASHSPVLYLIGSSLVGVAIYLLVLRLIHPRLYTDLHVTVEHMRRARRT